MGDNYNPQFQRTTWLPSSSEGDEDVEKTSIWEPSAEMEQPLLWLIVARPGVQRGTILAVEPDAVFGRSATANIRWEDPRVSREHARFELALDPEQPDSKILHYFLWPLKPRHPITVNGVDIRGATRLRENDEIGMGDTIFVVKILA